MDKNEVESYIRNHKQYFPSEKLAFLKDKLLECSVLQFNEIKLKKLKSPSFFRFISLFFGVLGVDRFMLGDAVMGILKYLTMGGCFLWVIYDFVKIADKVKAINFKEISSVF